MAFVSSSSFVLRNVSHQHYRVVTSTNTGNGPNFQAKPVSRSTVVSVLTDDGAAATSISTGQSTTDTMEKFWKLADESKVTSQYEADGNIQFLMNASLDDVKAVCLQYRYFVERYPDNLALLMSRMPNYQLKCLLAEIHAEELGSGRLESAHIVWYDNFLLSLGITKEELASSIYKENDDILNDIAFRCANRSVEHGIGLIGMGGECLCQIYLTVMHKFLMENEHIKAMDSHIDWTFWTYHIGEEDIEHRRLVRECIDSLGLGKKEIGELAEGYKRGKSTWDDFWGNNYKNTAAVAALN